MFKEIHQDAVLDLSGMNPVMCVFVRCTIVAQEPTRAAEWGRNTLVDCRFVGPAWPDWLREKSAWRAA